jgi:hypothetical protein
MVKAEPSETLHVAVRPGIQLPALSRGVADKVIELPTSIDGDGAVISTEATTAAVCVVALTTLIVKVLRRPLLPSAVTVAVPTARPVLVPVEVTETTLVLLLLHQTVRLSRTRVLARSVTLSPTYTCVLPSARTTAWLAVAPPASDGFSMSVGLTGPS